MYDEEHHIKDGLIRRSYSACDSCFQLMKIMVKVSDISNEARPMAVAEPWLDCLLQEFFNQVNKINLSNPSSDNRNFSRRFGSLE